MAIAGFCDPHKDPTEDDLKLWVPDADNPPKELNLMQARFLLAKVADQFCDLFHQEKMAIPENMSGSKYLITNIDTFQSNAFLTTRRYHSKIII